MSSYSKYYQLAQMSRKRLVGVSATASLLRQQRNMMKVSKSRTMRSFWSSSTSTRSQTSASIGISKRWILGLAIATPTAALIQGSLMLYEYRTEHGDAPRPISPSRGIVVVKTKQNNNNKDEATIQNNNSSSSSIRTETKNNSDNTSNNNNNNSANFQKRPLRILIAGDSLAAGVGVSKQATPILPESIAKSLSLASGGRAVHWTCVGTPGASASQIVDDILHYKASQREANILEKKLAEFQATARIAQLWIQEQQEKQKQKEEEKQNKQQKDDDDALSNNDNNNNNRIQQLFQRLNHDIQNIRKQIDEKQKLKEVETERIIQERRLVALRRRPTAMVLAQKQEEDNAEFDIAIVITGINDLKAALLPFMMSGSNSNSSTTSSSTNEKIAKASTISSNESENENNSSSNSNHDNNNNNNNDPSFNEGLTTELQRILHVLKDKMRIDFPAVINSKDPSTIESPDAITTTNEKQQQQQQQQQTIAAATTSRTRKRQRRSGPLIVFPALPADPLPLTKHAPLSWFSVPLIKMMEENKKLLAKRFPNFVLFVDSPTLKDIGDMENGKGPLYTLMNQIQPDQILLRVTDVAQPMKDNVEKLMKQHYDKFINNDSSWLNLNEDNLKIEKKNYNNNQSTLRTMIDYITTDNSATKDGKNGINSSDGINNNLSSVKNYKDTARIDNNSDKKKHKEENNKKNSSNSSTTGRRNNNVRRRSTNYISSGQDPFQTCCHDHLPSTTTGPNTPGWSMVAVDQVHPNDFGYDVWGCHIAAQIIKEWKIEDIIHDEND